MRDNTLPEELCESAACPSDVRLASCGTAAPSESSPFSMELLLDLLCTAHSALQSALQGIAVQAGSLRRNFRRRQLLRQAPVTRHWLS